MKRYFSKEHKSYIEACQRIVEQQAKLPCSAEQMIAQCRKNHEEARREMRLLEK